jgi:AhpD family alkylhydroperoxidase
MQSRIDAAKVAPGAYKALLGIEAYLHESGLELPLLHLIKLRASQINGCAYCLDMHWKDLRAIGESEQRLYSLDAWQEGPFYTDRERAALAWTEAVTRITEGHVPDEVYERARGQFSEKELADLTLALRPSMPGTAWQFPCGPFPELTSRRPNLTKRRRVLDRWTGDR